MFYLIIVLNVINKTRNLYLGILAILVIIFTLCLYSINYIYPKNDKSKKKRRI